MSISTLNKVLCLFVASMGIGVFGYSLDHKDVVAHSAFFVKPIAGILFFLIGMMLYFIKLDKSSNQPKRNKPIISIFVFLSLFCIAQVCWTDLSFFAGLTNNPPNIEFRPSFAGLICFVILSLRGLTYLFDTNKRKTIQTLGIIIGGISIAALIGHLTNTPKLYYVCGNDSGMRWGSAILFAILGFVLVTSKKHISENH